MPTVPPAYAFPFGIGSLPRELLGDSAEIAAPDAAGDDAVARAVATQFVQAPILLLLGDRDTDPTKPRPAAFNSSPEAMAQGPHRLARGHTFMAAGERTAEELGVKCAWELQIVPGVGHNGGAMTAVAVRLLFDPEYAGKVDTSGIVDPNEIALA